MTVLIEVDKAAVRYPRSSSVALHPTDFKLNQGAALGIVGESGSGKTTLGRILVGALGPTSGTVRIQGRAWSEIRHKDDVRRRVQMIFQDPYSALNPRLTPRQAVGEVLRVWGGLRKQEAGEQAARLLTEVGLAQDAFDRRPGQLSGGQCQRVGIARALAADPLVLVADEPTSSLDVSIQAQILNLLANLRQKRGLALVLISHDLSVIRHVTEETFVMYSGRVVERGPTRSVLSAPSHPYTRILLDSVPGNDGPMRESDRLLSPHSGCAFADRCPFMGQECLARPPALSRRDLVQVACVHPLGGPAASTQETIDASSPTRPSSERGSQAAVDG